MSLGGLSFGFGALRVTPPDPAASNGGPGTGGSSRSAPGSEHPDDLWSPLPALEAGLSEEDLREAAYEILVAAVAPKLSTRSTTSSTSRPLGRRASVPTTTSRIKQALGLRAKSPGSSRQGAQAQPIDIVRAQMQISESSDLRTRRALTRALAGQVGRRPDTLLVPVELLQHVGAAEFPSQLEFLAWKRRQLRLLEEGLLRCPLLKGQGSDPVVTRLKQLLNQLQHHDADLQNAELMQSLRAAAMTRAERPAPGDAREDVCHWADGFPLNIYLYEMLLRSCFDLLEDGVLIDEVDDVLELLKRTWGTLGISPVMHSACFAWVLFRQFVVGGQNERELLSAAEAQIRQVAKDVKDVDAGRWEKQQAHLLQTLLGSMQGYAEKRLLAYHEAFPFAEGVMESLIEIALLAEEILQGQERHAKLPMRTPTKSKEDMARKQVDTYIRSSMKAAFAELMESASSKRRSFKKGDGVPSPTLAITAQDTADLAQKQASNFTPILKQWHANAGGVAAATLHACYRRELKQFLEGLSVLTPEASMVLAAADFLEKELVQIAVEDAMGSDDGGKAVIREMPPFEADTVTNTLMQKWVDHRIVQLSEWIDRSVYQETWNAGATRGNCAASVAEVLRLAEDTLDAFFELPVPPDPDHLHMLVDGMNSCFELYVQRTLDSIGSKDQFVPPLPPLTRYKKELFVRVQQQQQKSSKRELQRQPSRRFGNGSVPKLESLSIQRLCVRINTLQQILQETEAMTTRMVDAWQALPSPGAQPTQQRRLGSKLHAAKRPLPRELESPFAPARQVLQKANLELCEFTAYRVVFYDLAPQLDQLYCGGVSNRRIAVLLDALDPALAQLAEVIDESLRDSVVLALAKACMDAFLRILLAGGPNRAYLISDAGLLDEDLSSLKDLFIAEGEGLPVEDVEKASENAEQILNLFACDTDEILEAYLAATREGSRINSTASKPSPNLVPPLGHRWSTTDAQTLLRVLCYRADHKASKALKKLYDLPKKVS
eukprot:SM000007S20982  [mRNA]  locus=s7:1389264:1394487:+ [translate_table: standard]